MPIYEFRCVECGNIEEFIFTGSSDQKEMKCSQCQGEDLERVMSQVSYSMKSSSSSAPGDMPSVKARKCGGNSCSTIELPGHTR